LFQASGGYAPACAGLIYYGARFRAKALTWRPFIAFGEGSYSMYLLHGWFLWLFSSQGVGEGLLMWGKVGVAWLFIAVCSLGCYRYFERPTRSWLRSALRPGVKLRMSEVTIAVQ
jgi:peptidoglycan/LPS O-acetylase OafA/YrhL